MEQRRLFTLEQANALLPQLQELLETLTSLRDEMQAHVSSMSQILEKVPHNGGGERANQYVLNLQHFNALIQSIQAIGCEIKDLDSGLVDFPSLREGRVVYLCWKRGEKQIEFWHELDTGFSGRLPL